MKEVSSVNHLPSRVIIITYNIHSMGGVPRSTVNIANGLVNRGFDLDIVSISPGAIPMFHNIDPRINILTCNSEIPSSQRRISSRRGRIIRDLLLKVFSRWKPRRLKFVKPLPAGISVLQTFLESVDATSSVIVVTDINSMDYVSAAYKNLALERPPIIAQYKGSVEALSPSRLKRVVETYKEVDLLLSLTPDDAELLRKNTFTDIDWITDPIPNPVRPAVNSRLNRLVTLGRLAPEKGLFEVLKAWKIASSSFVGWELVLFGEGVLREELENEINRLGIESTVRLGGKTDDPLAELEQAQALLLPSKHEGFGMVIAEAASVGTPTVAFNCSPGVRLQIEPGVNGILVPAGDIATFAKEIVRLVENSEYARSLGNNAKIMVQKFGVSSTIDKWETLFLKAVNNKRTITSKN